MFFYQRVVPRLAIYSYIVGDEKTREAAVIDPTREKAGASVAALAGKNLKRSVLELGGNDPFIVLEDADMKSTVESAVKRRMVNAGQSCVASKRFIVVESVADEFISSFEEQMGNLKMGDPLDEDTTLGPLSSESAAENLVEQVQAAINAGATVLLGGDRPAREGAFFNATILTGVTPDMPSFTGAGTGRKCVDGSAESISRGRQATQRR